mmetsp:Transcript_76460/g.183177  ORF Transcript_76460/g.183177 Transcript_76460/m.183177 type:complete len:96 (+) Transcript_76460:77-364(+)
MARFLSIAMMLFVLPSWSLRSDTAGQEATSVATQAESSVIESHARSDFHEAPPKLPICEGEVECKTNKRSCKICGVNFECMVYDNYPSACVDLGR